MSTNVLGYRLCYVKDNLAWFTSLPLEKQWGDDWDDAPYQHNASPPYDATYLDGEMVGHDLVKIAYVGPLDTPENFYPQVSKSVQEINRGCVPWLQAWGEGGEGLHAGVTVTQFLEFAKKVGAEVFLPEVIWTALLVQGGVEA